MSAQERLDNVIKESKELVALCTDVNDVEVNKKALSLLKGLASGIRDSRLEIGKDKEKFRDWLLNIEPGPPQLHGWCKEDFENDFGKDAIPMIIKVLDEEGFLDEYQYIFEEDED